MSQYTRRDVRSAAAGRPLWGRPRCRCCARVTRLWQCACAHMRHMVDGLDLNICSRRPGRGRGLGKGAFIIIVSDSGNAKCTLPRLDDGIDQHVKPPEWLARQSATRRGRRQCSFEQARGGEGEGEHFDQVDENERLH